MDIASIIGMFCVVALNLIAMGPLIGLALMLHDLSDPAAIGTAMAVAISTVFYGVAMAYLFCLPIKTKLQFHLNILNEATLNVD